MKTKKALFFILAAILGGCIPSLHPLFTARDVFFEPQLVGTWAGEDAKDKWQFRPNITSANLYEVVYTDDQGVPGTFMGALGKIDGMMFLDLFPGDAEIQANDLYKMHLLPVHTFMKIEQIQPTLKMYTLDPEHLTEMLKQDPNLIKHEIVGKDKVLVLTASTPQLQQFLKTHANDKDLFNDPLEIKKLESADPNTPSDDSNPKTTQSKAIEK